MAPQAPTATSSIALPSLFISHGAPTFAIDAGTTGPALTRWGRALAEAGDIKGVVILSPHWMARGPAVMTNPVPATWHDFGGFPPELYQLNYPAPGDAALGEQVLALLAQAGITAQPDPKRPLDHGAWVPLMHLFPAANVPVVQVALPAGWGPAQVYAMGQALRSLRTQGVLVVGSGSMTHNLAEVFGGGFGGGLDAGPTAAAPYVTEFSRWIEAALVRGDLPALLDYRTRAPHAPRAHPTDEHFLPLFFALGAADDPFTPHYLSREVTYGMLAMDTVVFGGVGRAG